jgi:hypothetical protein
MVKTMLSLVETSIGELAKRLLDSYRQERLLMDLAVFVKEEQGDQPR